MNATGSAIERIPLTPELARELDVVGGSAARRARGPVLAITPVLWLLLFAGLRDAGVLPAALIASGLAGGLLAWILLFSRTWGAQVASAPFIVRERGPVRSDGAVGAFMTGDKTARMLRVGSGPIHLDNDIHAVELERLWRTVRASPGTVLDVDYTPRRYLLAVRDPAGQTLFARQGYDAPAGGAVIPASPGDFIEPSSVAISQYVIGATSILGVVPVFWAVVTFTDPAGSSGLGLLFALIALLANGIFFVGRGIASTSRRRDQRRATAKAAR